MTTATTETPKTTKAPAKRAPAAKTARTQAAAATRSPTLHFCYAPALHDKLDQVLLALETQPSQSGHGEAMADVINDLIEAGMEYYFMKPLKAAEVGFMGEQSARLGMSGAVKLISSVCRKFMTRMDQKQLLVVAAHIRDLGTT